MLKMSEETRAFLQKNLPNSLNATDVNDILDPLDELMLFSLDKEDNPTEATRPIIKAYDDLFYSNN